MYDTKFLPQLEEFRRYLFGHGVGDTREASDEAHRRYVPPPGMRFLKCHEDVNGEWVPSLEEVVEASD